MDLSIIIVNFNTKDLITACLASIKKWQEHEGWEIIVIDNASTDGSVETLRKMSNISLVLNKKNLGFAKANNKGIKIAKGKYILLLNSDTEIRQNSLQTMIRFMDTHPKAAAVTCRLELESGAMDPACHRGFPTPWASLTYMTGLEKIFPRVPLFAGYHMGYKDMSVPHEVDTISGAFYMVRRSAIEDVGLLDEDFFFYAEDIDWSYRFKQKGWEIWFNPDARVLHKKKQSGRSNESRELRVQTEIYFHTYNWLFFKKHYERKYGLLISIPVNVFYWLRLNVLKHLSI